MPNNPRSITQIKAELDEILSWFETGEADVATAVTKYEQGLKALAELEEQLKSAKLKVKRLEQKFDSE